MLTENRIGQKIVNAKPIGEDAAKMSVNLVDGMVNVRIIKEGQTFDMTIDPDEAILIGEAFIRCGSTKT